MTEEEKYWAQYPDTLTPADVARITRTSIPTVCSRLAKGALPGHHIGDAWLVFKPEFREWLVAHSNQTDAAPGGYGHVLDAYPDELSPRDLMQLLRVSYKGTIYRWLDHGTIPGTLISGRWISHKWQIRELFERTSNQNAST
ncbi:helix-turn-helix domain-containing protein [Microbacterium testaceum]|nr:helix-turn-helix domain-containing protein [Microbacterium testaceum]